MGLKKTTPAVTIDEIVYLKLLQKLSEDVLDLVDENSEVEKDYDIAMAEFKKIVEDHLKYPHIKLDENLKIFEDYIQMKQTICNISKKVSSIIDSCYDL
jgi:disulfide oxidoreductase YuzD